MCVFSNNVSKTVNVTDPGAGSIGELISCWWTWSTVVVHHATGLMNYNHSNFGIENNNHYN